MKFRYSPGVNAAYLRFADEGVRIVNGIEFLKAAETLPKSLLDQGLRQ